MLSSITSTFNPGTVVPEKSKTTLACMRSGIDAAKRAYTVIDLIEQPEGADVNISVTTSRPPTSLEVVGLKFKSTACIVAATVTSCVGIFGCAIDTVGVALRAIGKGSPSKLVLGMGCGIGNVLRQTALTAQLLALSILSLVPYVGTAAISSIVIDPAKGTLSRTKQKMKDLEDQCAVQEKQISALQGEILLIQPRSEKESQQIIDILTGKLTQARRTVTHQYNVICAQANTVGQRDQELVRTQQVYHANIETLKNQCTNDLQEAKRSYQATLLTQAAPTQQLKETIKNLQDELAELRAQVQKEQAKQFPALQRELGEKEAAFEQLQTTLDQTTQHFKGELQQALTPSQNQEEIDGLKEDLENVLPINQEEVEEQIEENEEEQVKLIPWNTPQDETQLEKTEVQIDASQTVTTTTETTTTATNNLVN